MTKDNPFTKKAKKANRWNAVKKSKPPSPSRKLAVGSKLTITWTQDLAYSTTGQQKFTGTVITSDGWLKMLNSEGVTWYGPVSILTKIRHHD